MSFKAFFLSLTIVSILLFSAFGTTTAYADDGTTTETTETGTPSTEESVTPDAVEETPQPEESVSPEETPQPEEEVVDTEATPQPEETVTVEETVATEEATSQPEEVVEEVATETSPEPLLEQLPDNTTITVVNSEGEAQPLATQESADAIESAYDPIWCPEGQSPTPGENGCTESFSSFDELLSFLEANEGDALYQQAGTIYIQQGEYLGGESSVDFNNYTFNSLNNYNLTLQGGWDTTADPDSGVYTNTQFNVPITVGSSTNPWIGSLTFNNIWISGVSGDTGLTVFTEGDLTLSGVEITDSQTGADLNAEGDVTVENSKFNNNKNGGAVINAGGVVNVESSEFNNNKSKYTNGGGLEVHGGSDVSLYEVTANENGLFGANVSANGIVFVDFSVFSGNVTYTYSCWGKKATGGYGLQAVSTGDIYLNTVTAENNYSFGASLTGANVEVYNGVFGNNDELTLPALQQKGLEINSAGYVILDNVQATENQNFGLNVEAVDFVTISNSHADNNKKYGANITTSGAVTVNNSFFDGNKSYSYSCKGNTYYGYGLQIVTSEGIYLTNVSASENNLFGASLDGNVVNIFGGFFNNNGSDSGKTLTGFGVEIISDTDITISDIEANNNQLFGANMQAVDDVTISNGLFNGNKVYTYSCKGQTVAGGGYGLQIVTGGDITLTDIGASDNYLYGAHLVGANVDIAVASNLFNTFNNNGSGSLQNPVGKGLEIESTGDVSLVSVEANNNQLFGADIEADGGVAITDGFFNGNKAYTYSCKGKTYYGYGLQIVTSEDISLINIEANENYLFGAHLEGTNVFVSYGSFSDNSTGNPSDHVGKGLEIVSTGEFTQVSLYQVTANNNQLFGANIQADGAVSVSNSTFSGNVSYTSTCKGKTYDGYGLKVVTPSNISLFDVAANNNGLYGAHLEGANVNIGATSGLFSTFSNNGSGDPKNPTGKGLEVVSTGNVTLLNVEANNNQLFGANVQADGNVEISNSFFSNNVFYTSGWCKGTTYDGYGLKVVTTNGNITLNAVTANDNGLYGASLDGTLDINVSDSTFNNNITSSGLIITGGNVTLNNVTASNNGADGVTICKADSVEVNNSTFTENDEYGLKVASPVFSESGNTYLNNGSGSLFYDPTSCVTNGGNNGGNNGHGWGNNGHGWGKNWGKGWGWGYKWGHSFKK